jgi:hypothetical protein
MCWQVLPGKVATHGLGSTRHDCSYTEELVVSKRYGILLLAAIACAVSMVLQALGQDCMLGEQGRTTDAPCNCCEGLICCECQ